jgi:hypothetical protein
VWKYSRILCKLILRQRTKRIQHLGRCRTPPRQKYIDPCIIDASGNKPRRMALLLIRICAPHGIPGEHSRNTRGLSLARGGVAGINRRAGNFWLCQHEDLIARRIGYAAARRDSLGLSPSEIRIAITPHTGLVPHE